MLLTGEARIQFNLGEALEVEEVGKQEAFCGGETTRPCVGLGLLVTDEVTIWSKLSEALEVEEVGKQEVFCSGETTRPFVGLGLLVTGEATMLEQDSIGKGSRG